MFTNNQLGYNNYKVYSDTLDSKGLNYRATITKVDMQYSKTFYFTYYEEVLAYHPYFLFEFYGVDSASEDLNLGDVYLNWLEQWQVDIETTLDNVDWFIVHQELMKVIE